MNNLFYILTVPAFKFWIQNKMPQQLTDRDWQSIFDYEEKKTEVEISKDYLSDKVDDYIKESIEKLKNK